MHNLNQLLFYEECDLVGIIVMRVNVSAVTHLITPKSKPRQAILQSRVVAVVLAT